MDDAPLSVPETPRPARTHLPDTLDMPWRPSHRTLIRRGAVVGAVAILLTGFLTWFGLWEQPYRPDAAEQVDSVPGEDFEPGEADLPEDQTAGRGLEGDQTVAFPATGTYEVDMTAGEAARVDELGVTLTPVGADAPRQVRISLDSASAADGLQWEIERIDGSSEPARVAIAIDYGAWRNAGGADWDDRLKVYTADGTEIASVNDAADATLTAELALTETRSGGGYAPPSDTGGDAHGQAPASSATASFTVAASASGDNGTFTATTLAPSSTWSSGNPTGDFAWSYLIEVPSSPGSLDPSVTLAYSSSSVDGRNEATNNQPSLIGEGFSYQPGFIERRYTPCKLDDEDGPNNPPDAETGGDQCWRTDNAVLSLNGSGGELIRDDDTGEWRIKNDDASKVEKLTGATNGDDDGEYWRVTTSAGIEYYFGLNRLPGYGSGDAQTGSTSTVPVFGNHSGEPCHASAFEDSWCDQAWRWQLDWVVDTHDNAIAYFYEGETNHYLLNLDEDEPVDYDRAANLTRVDYGLRDGDGYAGATHRVVFDLADRCTEDSTCDYDHPENWPDTPLDQYCDGTADDCADLYSPTFFTDQRLASITTQANVDGTWTGVDEYTLRHSFPDPGDSTRAGLWLEGIQRTGLAGDDPIAMPEITFDGVQLSNRVQKSIDTKAPMNWWRISAIRNGTGGVTTVEYSDTECDAKNDVMPSSPEDNDMRCMPVVTTLADDNGGVTEYDWYHKYLVEKVAEIDTVGDSPPVTTRYEYIGDPAWHFTDDDGLTDPEYKTWSQYRGYGKVRTVKGDGSDELLVSETTYFRGLDGQELPDGTTTDVEVDGITDHDEFAGRPRTESTILDGQVISETTYTPWRSAPTATRDRDWGTVHARHTGTSTIEATSLLADGSWRTVATETKYDSWGMAYETESSGDTAVTGDEECTKITYARNTAEWILALPVRTEYLAVACDEQPSYPDDVISDERVYYDGSTTFGTAPTTGDVTRTETLQDYVNGSPEYLVTGSVTVDDYGRGLTSTDVDGNVTTTEYTPATGGPITEITTINPLDHVTTQILEPLRGQAVESIDANGNVTEMAYDALGRLATGWAPDRARDDGYEPTATFEYHLNDDAASATVTHGIGPNGDYTTTYELFDGLLRPVQTQIPAPGGGRVLSDTFYDTRGLVRKQHGAYFNSAEPSATLFSVSDNEVPSMTAYERDTTGRVTDEVFYSFGQELWRTTTVYDGEETTVIDPDGRAATSVTDAKGNTIELRNLHTTDPDGAADTIGYEYDRAGRLVAMTDTGGNEWTYEYDLRGRRTAVDDPDTGRSETTYYDNGLVESVTDSRGESIWYEYDDLGRVRYVMDGDFWGEVIKSYTYDTFGLGLPATTSTWDDDGNLFRTRILGYDDANRPVGVRYTLNGDLGALDRSFDFRYEYYQDGSVAEVKYPAAGGLPEEGVITAYDDLGLPTATYSARQWYVSQTAYTKFAEPQQLVFDPDGPNVSQAPVAWQAYTYADGTRRVTNSDFSISTGPDHVISDTDYAYSDGGLITSIDNQSDWGADTQCFVYDHLKRITDAWTGAAPAACEAEPTTTADVGGAAPYWQSWTFDDSGNRSGQVDHLAGQTIDYTYDEAQPHTVTAATVTTAESTQTLNYAYDTAGNTTSRPNANGVAQSLTWSADGKLETLEQGGDVTDYQYTADGSRIARTDPDGTMTVFLPGMEVVKHPDGTVTASRYYSHGGQQIAVRTNDDTLHWLGGDLQGTTTATVDSETHAVQVRYFDLYGNTRGTPVASWVDDHGFLGGTEDPSGLTHLGAREYDPILGRFISADPVLDATDAQQMTGYAYANYSPVTFADPSGMRYESGDGQWAPSSQQDPNWEWRLESGWYDWEPPPPKPPSDDDLEEANEIMNTSTVDIVIDVAGDILLDLIGVNDLMSCIGGDVWGCATLIMDLIPWSKVFTLGKKIYKAVKTIYKAINAFEEKMSWAKSIMRRKDAADRAADAAEDTADTTSDLAKTASSCPLPGNSFTADTEVVMADGSTKLIDEVEPGDEVLATDEDTGETGPREVDASMVKTAERVLVEIAIDTDGDGRADDTVTATDEHPIWVADLATVPEEEAFGTNLTEVEPVAIANPAAEADGSGSGGGGPPTANLSTTTGHENGPETTAGDSNDDHTDSPTATDADLPGLWVNAIDLKTGQLLRTSAGTWIQITAVETRTEQATVYNLTVADLHTYHVAAADTDFLTHNDGCGIGTQVDYNSDELSSAAFQGREKAGVSDGRNVAAAKIEGSDEIITGFSKGDGYHAEQHIIDQLRKRNISPGKITDLYTERQPCGSCTSAITELAPGANVTWSVPWGNEVFPATHAAL